MFPRTGTPASSAQVVAAVRRERVVTARAAASGSIPIVPVAIAPARANGTSGYSRRTLPGSESFRISA